MSMRFVLALISVVCALALSGVAAAQSKPAPAAQDDTGLTSYVEFGGTSNSDGQVYELQSNVGYTFTKHFGMDLEVPVYFVNASSSTTGGIGNPSVDLRWKFLNPTLNYGSVLTGSAPLGSSKRG